MLKIITSSHPADANQKHILTSISDEIDESRTRRGPAEVSLRRSPISTDSGSVRDRSPPDMQRPVVVIPPRKHHELSPDSPRLGKSESWSLETTCCMTDVP